MKRLFLLAILSLSFALVAVSPGSSVKASSGGITSVCESGSSLTVIVTASSNSNATIAVFIQETGSYYTNSLTGDGQSHAVVFGISLPGGQVGVSLHIQAGDYNNGAIGGGFTSSTYYTPGNCSLPIGYGNGGTTGIPYGFVQRGINCTVAVFNTPDGTQVGSNTIIKGQNWYVSLKPVKGKFNRLWTEIYVSGPIDGFIPTKCVLPYAFSQAQNAPSKTVTPHPYYQYYYSP